ncbi:nicotinate phosphoribosyltransferase [Mycobacterium saskatchewanense]|uniref:Nicotinamide phosphoribosyltransferase n=1 Tax=Mycobacterium saskatchewanense TaxID=220927 RepID=A0AAJ3TVY5_9MYCO|nr:nicotinate phosphoribosyltransferase [Mycobacterium saskatchewanense]ORW69852.1 nicotinate phosphoribosyltransferase [Mycobacterium saskatchewanense]BBX61091.1 nicotinate phosphoribosyltransferase [Mycobacterium saskatchewanense]
MPRILSNFDNLILNTDTYKHSHWNLYPPGTEYVSSYIESRGGPFPAHLFVGLQAFVKKHLLRPLTIDDIDEAEIVTRQHEIPFNRKGWLGVVNDHGGYLPVEIQAVPEGTVLPNKNVLVQVVNTDPEYPWATSFFETALLRAIWYPTSVATTSWLAKQLIREALEKTSDHPEILRDVLQDYGARGVSSQESAALGGLAHLINFRQTNTISGSLAATLYYNALRPAISQPNSEHTTVTSWGRENEAKAHSNLIEQYKGWPFVVAVSDSYDLDNAVHKIFGGELKEQIINSGSTILVRPDSGDPPTVISDTIEGLIEEFGSQTNSKGYRVLPDYVRTAQGDGLTLESLKRIYAELDRRGLAADNIYLGMGGGLLQYINRDSLAFAQKASAAKIDGEWVDVFKEPKTDTAKQSKRGRLALVLRDGEYRTVRQEEAGEGENLLRTVYRNGKLLVNDNFEDLIERSERPVPRWYYAPVHGSATADQPTRSSISSVKGIPA